MTVNVTDSLKDFIRNIMSDRQFAGNYAEDPQGMLAAQGVTDHDLSAVDVQAAVREVCADPSVPAEARTAVQNSGPPPSSGGASHSVDSVVQHLNHITYATYEGDDYITNLIDQSVDNSVDISGPVFGDVNAVTGEQGQIIDGPNFGQANTGDGAVQAGDDASGVNTGVNTGINAGGDVENAVVGDGNQSAQVSGDADGTVFNFGGGDVNNLGNADIDDSSLSFGDGDATTISDVTVDDGSAIAVGGNASGSNVEDNDTTVVTTVEDNDTTSNDTTINDNDVSLQDNDTTVTAVQDNDVVQDNDTAVAGDDQLAVQ
ncbi:hypothetical protein [Actinophytocola algeriensis]|uniref:Uncharacterized protein n=1 Tax=Actinophytocola algeriensis TaxID=1768010 RepID=A0A7W7VIC4_9PSEU|nr:hypothetical protein [Actinophytocola algeriensis]MBB4910935.1 hypothetical protein [Actinophytocola algeriensis]MBE1473928.1 hypothetical protein [Actinophytocola algeriensis]